MPKGARGLSGRARGLSGRAEREVYLLYRFGAEALRLLPEPVARALGGGIGRLAGVLDPKRRAVVAGNLGHVLGPAADRRQLDRVVGRAFAAYGHYWAEAARLRPSDRQLLEGRVEMEGADRLFEAARSGRGAVLALPHLGIWEVGGLWSATQGVPLTAVAEPLSPPELFDWFVAQRRALGIEVVRLGGGAAGKLSAALRDGKVIALLADRDVAGDGIEVEFFGERTRLPGGPALLALRTGAALLPCAIYDLGGGRHRGVLRPALEVERRGHLREDVARLTQALAHELEVLIRARPEQWHVFQPNWPSVAPLAPAPSASAPSVAGRRRAPGAA